MAKPSSDPRPLSDAFALYDAGNVAEARRRAQALLSASPAEAEASAARELILRTRTPLWAFAPGLAVAALWLLLVLLAWLRS